MTFVAALILGLLASAHCAGMCGGLQTVLQQPMVIRSRRQAAEHLTALNIGRITTYCLAGFIFATFGRVITNSVDIPEIAQFARIVVAVMMVLIGLQLLISSIKPFIWIERIGAGFWRFVSKYITNDVSHKLRHSFKLGIIWGFLPCGLVYAVLFTTLFSQAPYQGVLTMLGFGLGTLPVMLLTGGLYQTFRNFISNKFVRIVGSLVFIQSGILMMTAPYWVNMDFMRAYPELMTTLFCLS